MNTILLQAAAQQQGGGLQMIIMLVVMVVIFYFFMIRPQNKKQKEIMNFRNSLSAGQEVVTIGGIYGTIKSVNEADNTVVLEIATGVKITVAKEGINAIPQKKSKTHHYTTDSPLRYPFRRLTPGILSFYSYVHWL